MVSEGSDEPRSGESRSPWNDPRFVVEGLEAASCGPHAKTLAIEGIHLAAEGRTAENWRSDVAVRHAGHAGRVSGLLALAQRRQRRRAFPRRMSAIRVRR